MKGLIQLFALYVIIYFLLCLFIVLPFYKWINADIASSVCLWIALVILILLSVTSCVYCYNKTYPFVSKRKRGECILQIAQNILSDSLLTLQYDEAIKNKNYNEVIPTQEEIKKTVFRNYYKEFYKSEKNLALLYVMAQNPTNSLTQHPLNQLMILNFDNVDEHNHNELILNKFPWLIRVDLYGFPLQKNK